MRRELERWVMPLERDSRVIAHPVAAGSAPVWEKERVPCQR
jgi:hypothetical protein